jgi:uncharacterized protein
MTARLRAHHLLPERDGSCRLLYDLERTLLMEVPEPLRGRIDSALAAPDSELAAWLADENLLTGEAPLVWNEESRSQLPALTDLSLDIAGACNMGCVYCFEREIPARAGRMTEETALAAVDFLFSMAMGAPKVALHFGSGEPLLRFDLLQTIVAAATRRAAEAGQELSLELTTNGTLVTPAIAEYLRDHPFHVRVSCDGPPAVHNQMRPLAGGQESYGAVERGLRMLLEHLPDRVTVNSVLAGGTRLRDLWAWAGTLGLKHYHVIKVGAYTDDDVSLRSTELADFAADLAAICDDMYADLVAGRQPVNYQPITKIVRRLMIPQPVIRFCGAGGSYLGAAANGKLYPCFRHLGISQYELGDIWHGADAGRRREFRNCEAADVDRRPVCQDCWARYLCGGGCYADSSVYGPDKTRPQVQHCPFWRAEVEAAIRFYHRLISADPAYCLRLFGDELDAVLAAMGGELQFMQPKNCD